MLAFAVSTIEYTMALDSALFANTPGGAQSSSVIYSLIETAKESGLDPYRYLTWLLTNAPILAARDDSRADKFLPANAPADCHSLQQNS